MASMITAAGQQQRRFEFHCAGLPKETFAVSHLSGEERLSDPFRFELLLVAEAADVNFEAVLEQEATLRIWPWSGSEEGAALYRGVVSEFEELYQVDRYALYRAVLRPRLWLLSRYFLSEVYLNKTVPQVIEQVLNACGLSTTEYETRFQGGPYPTHEYLCQWQESYLDFISRLMEREGIYYYFESAGDRFRLVITDHRMTHSNQVRRLAYRLESELDVGVSDDGLRKFGCRRELAPRRVTVRNYDYNKASHEVQGQVQAEANGVGEVFLYGEYADSDSQAGRLAQVRAEALAGQAERFEGASTAAGLRTGEFIEVAGCYRESFNARYLPVEVRHWGSQTGLLLAGLGDSAPLLAAALAERRGFALWNDGRERNVAGSQAEQQLYYRNEFMAIRSELQFRPARRTPWPRVAGVMNAFIDAEGSGKYPELDEQGRYKVQLPFDLTDKAAQKASAWIRLATPYTSPGAGMHFPLLKGTEVLLSFVDGDPDRPIITGTVYNSTVLNVVTSHNPTRHIIHTPGNNQFEMEDLEGQEHITLRSPRHSYITLGVPSSQASAGGSNASSPTQQQGSQVAAPQSLDAIGTSSGSDGTNGSGSQSSTGTDQTTGSTLEMVTTGAALLSVGQDIPDGVASKVPMTDPGYWDKSSLTYHPGSGDLYTQLLHNQVTLVGADVGTGGNSSQGYSFTQIGDFPSDEAPRSQVFAPVSMSAPSAQTFDPSSLNAGDHCVKVAGNSLKDVAGGQTCQIGSDDNRTVGGTETINVYGDRKVTVNATATSFAADTTFAVASAVGSAVGVAASAALGGAGAALSLASTLAGIITGTQIQTAGHAVSNGNGFAQTTYGNNSNTTFGNASITAIGTRSDTTVGVKSMTLLGADTTLRLGVIAEDNVGYRQEYHLGNKSWVTISEQSATLDSVHAKLNMIDNIASYFKNQGIKIEDSLTEVVNSELNSDLATLRLLNSGFTSIS